MGDVVRQEQASNRAGEAQVQCNNATFPYSTMHGMRNDTIYTMTEMTDQGIESWAVHYSYLTLLLSGLPVDW